MSKILNIYNSRYNVVKFRAKINILNWSWSKY